MKDSYKFYTMNINTQKHHIWTVINVGFLLKVLNLKIFVKYIFMFIIFGKLLLKFLKF